MLLISLVTFEYGIKEYLTKQESYKKCGQMTPHLQIDVKRQQEKYKLSGMFANAEPNLIPKGCQRTATLNSMVVYSLVGTVGCIVNR